MNFYYPDVANNGESNLHLQPNTVSVCAKASEGSTFMDPSFTRFRSEAAALGSFFFGYHWTWCSSPDAEAQNCRDMVGDVPIMWDIENLQKIQTVPGIIDLSKRFRARGGHDKLAYLPLWYWRDHMGKPDLRPLEDIGLRIVASYYTVYSDNAPGWEPYGNVTPYILQYTDKLAYGGQFIDFNACKDTFQNFLAFMGASPAPAPAPIPTQGDEMLTHWQTLSRGAQGGNVRIAQGLLVGHGYSVGSHGVDGDYGPTTEGSVRAMQQAYGITVDGIFGPQTLSVALYNHDYSH